MMLYIYLLIYHAKIIKNHQVGTNRPTPDPRAPKGGGFVMTRRMIDMFKRESDVARFPKLRRCVFCFSENLTFNMYAVGIH